MVLCKIDWMNLSEQLFGAEYDSNYVSWDQAHQVFYHNKTAFEYNMSRLQTMEIPIAKWQASLNYLEARKKYSQE